MLKGDAANEHTLQVLGTLLLSSPPGGNFEQYEQTVKEVLRLPVQEIENLLEQAVRQRVLRRTLEVLRPHLLVNPDVSRILEAKLCAERARAQTLLTVVDKIVRSFQRRGYPVLVMKTLDHWPDTGSDVDLLATGDDSEISAVLESDFGAVRLAQSWGDRLAHKFNFSVPGLRELVEIHIGCLGQTGEQEELAEKILSRRLEEKFGDCLLPVPAREDRIIIATLQRMYRHYYIRLTDIINIFSAVASDVVDFEQLRHFASESSVWPGVATLVTIVCEHGERFGGAPVTLPTMVTAAAMFDSKHTYVDHKFVRVPVMPEAANLYLLQLAENGRSRNLRAVARLSLLPILASAAFVAFRITGNDKGIW